MGLFSWLFGTPSRVTNRDVVWLTDSARLRGIVRAAQAHLAANRSVLVLAHFPASLAAFGEQIISMGLPYGTIPTSLPPATALELAKAPPQVLLGLVRNLEPAELLPLESGTPSPLAVVVIERHPLRKHDDRVIQFAEGLGSRATIEFHVSMNDPLMVLFAGEWVSNMLRALGMQENETIDSRMVTRRIEQAQAKIAKMAGTDADADSAAEWLERNRTR